MSVTQNPSQLNLFTDDTTQIITTSASPSSTMFTPVFAVGLTSNPNSSCPASLGFSQNGGTGQVNTTVTGGPYICSGIFNALATANATTSSNATTIVVPPEAMIEQMLGAANGFTPTIDPAQRAQQSVSVAVLNRFLDPANFYGLTTWQARHDYLYTANLPASGKADGGCFAINATQEQCHVIENAVISSYATNLITNAITNAGMVFSWPLLHPGDNTLVGDPTELIGGASCYWSPTLAQWTVVQSALGSTTFPTGVGAPICYSGNAQILWRTDMPNSPVNPGAPAFLFVRQLPSPSAPRVVP